jgi:hypothetical protein
MLYGVFVMSLLTFLSLYNCEVFGSGCSASIRILYCVLALLHYRTLRLRT